MSENVGTEKAAQEINEAIDRMTADMPHMASLLDAFRELFSERASIKAELPEPAPIDITLDPLKFSQGVPMLKDSAFVAPGDSIRWVANRLIPVVKRSFPAIAAQLGVISAAVESESPWSEDLTLALTSGDDEGTANLAHRLGIDPDTIKFVSFQTRKPFAEKRAECSPAVPDGYDWLKGYCPLCGAWPELSFLEGQEGRRFLRCSFCGHEWKFMRTQCPFCETTDQDKLELFFSEDRDFERAELCHECKKYVVGIDLRNRVIAPPRELIALGLVYLDILAQERGFEPGARCTWNVI